MPSLPDLMADGSSSEVSISSNDQSPMVKCIVVGDGGVGKTSLVVSYSANKLPGMYTPTTFDNYTVTVRVDEKPMRLQLCDTSGQLQNDFNLLRTLCYANADVFLVCFSVVCPSSFASVSQKWIPEIRHYCPLAPIVLVGTQYDCRSERSVLTNLKHRGERPVSENEGRQMAEDVGAVMYIECSAMTRHCIKEVFDTAIFAALDQRGFVTRCRMASIRRSNKYRCKSELWAGSTDEKSNSGKKCRKPWRHLCCFMS